MPPPILPSPMKPMRAIFFSVAPAEAGSAGFECAPRAAPASPGRRSYFPVQSPGRFSTNAAMPSFWSSVPNRPWNSRRSNRMPWASVGLERGVDHLLVGHDRERRHAGDRRRRSSPPPRPDRRRARSGDQPRPLGLVGVHHPAGQAHLHRLGLADRARQALRSAHAGRDAELDLGLAELGAVGGEDEIGTSSPARNRRPAHSRRPRRSPACASR